MNLENFNIEIEDKLNKLNIQINDNQKELLFKYMELMLEWNEKINLTAITDPSEIILKHFVDSLTILNDIKEESNIIDVGTGAGLPGIPLNILNDNLKYILLDSLNKRIIFLNEVISKLKLNNIKTIHSRVEDYSIKNKESFDIATSRAVAPLNILVEYLLPLVKVGGKCICMKGSEAQEEISQAEVAIEILGGKVEEIRQIVLPDTDIKRNIIIIRKIKETPSNYPRRAGIANKKPIK